MDEDEIDRKMARALIKWVKAQGKTPADFARDMGWAYNHAWRVLREKDPFTPPAWGQFILVYGMDKLNELFRMAGIEVPMKE